MGGKLVTNILAALDQQTVLLRGAPAILPRLADSLKTCWRNEKPSLAKSMIRLMRTLSPAG